ncbi:MAG: methyltransferase domain-containing protein [Thermomicrobiales bacterium]
MDPRFYESYFHHEDHHWWFRWRYELITGIIRKLDLGPNPRILDAGCGTGQMLKRLEALGTAIGIDSSAEAVSFAASRGARRLVRGTINAPPFPAGSFDCIVVLDVIEHVDDDTGILRSLRDAVRPGGSVIVTVPAFRSLWSEHDVINRHKRRYNAGELRALLDRAGLEVDRLTYCNTALCAPVYLMRTFRNLTRRGSRVQVNGHELRSDLRQYPDLVNYALLRVMRAETRLMRRVDFPFGVSILAVARRPAVTGSITAIGAADARISRNDAPMTGAARL